MNQDNPPPHALFVEWGRFKARAFGIPAIITLAIIAIVALLKVAGWL